MSQVYRYGASGRASERPLLNSGATQTESKVAAEGSPSQVSQSPQAVPKKQSSMSDVPVPASVKEISNLELSDTPATKLSSLEVGTKVTNSCMLRIDDLGSP